jgi:hypothetical protein
VSRTVERLARIIAPEAFEPCEAGEVCPFCQGSRDVARAKAREIIEILREPTGGIAQALDRIPGGWGRGAWAAGFDAILGD